MEQISKICSWVVIATGLAICAGWQFRIPILKGQALGTFVAPNTALCFILAGTSILLQRTSRKLLHRFGQVIGFGVFSFAVLTGLEYLLLRDFGIDRLFMSHRLSDWTLPLPGRFAINSVIGFAIAGLSLTFLKSKSRIPWSEFCSAVVVLVAYLSLVAYVFGASVLYDHVMALHTAILFAILGVALLCASEQSVLVGSLVSPLAGAVASRKMIVWVALLLPVFGATELWAEEAGIVSLRLGTALAVIASVTVFSILALRTAVVLNETDRKRIEGEAALLKTSQLAVAGRMAASIAHEVNNPLESVTNLIFLLKSDGLPEETRQAYIEIAEREITRVAAIARRTLGFYREDSRQTTIDLNEMLEGVIDVYRDKLAGGSVKLQRAYCDDARIKAKAGEIRQIITNLVVNAMDALRRSGGTLMVSTVRTDSSVSVIIADDGPGISDENLKRIYEPFFTTKSDIGTGLGLWVSRELATKNNGSIKVESSTNDGTHGTRFEVTFPSVSGMQQSDRTTTEAQV